jgi:hypothetical protein
MTALAPLTNLAACISVRVFGLTLPDAIGRTVRVQFTFALAP